MSPKDEKKQVLLYAFKYIFNLKSRCLLHFLLTYVMPFERKCKGYRLMFGSFQQETYIPILLLPTVKIQPLSEVGLS